MRGALLLIAASLAASAQSGGVVSGRVTSSTQGEPVPGATVTLRGLDSRTTEIYIAQTGADGRFSVSNVVPGTYEPRPSKIGYEQQPPGSFPTAGDFPPVTVEAAKAVTPVALHLIPDGVIAGRVTDNDGGPVRRASIEAQQYAYVAGKKQLRTIHAAQTDDRGQYRLYHVPPGKYWLRVEPLQSSPVPRPVLRAQMQIVTPLNGLAAAFYPASPDVAHATELQLAPGAEIDGIDVRLSEQRIYSIRGRMSPVDPAQGGFNVFAQNLTGEMRGNRFSTFYRNGEYEIAGVPPGKYSVIGQQFPNPQQKGSSPLYAREIVEVVDRDVDHVDLTFSPYATIKGVVKAEGSATVKDVMNLSLTPDALGQMTMSAGTRIEADGTFTLNAAPGVYRVRIYGSQVYLKSLLIGKEPMPDRKIDTAHLSGDLTLIVISDYGRVEGTVVDGAGKPVYNADVTLIPDQRQEDWQDRFRSTLTKADGTFTVTAVQPGEYRIYAWLGAERGAPLDSEFRKPFENHALVVKVEANGKQIIELKIIQAAH